MPSEKQHACIGGSKKLHKNWERICKANLTVDECFTDLQRYEAAVYQIEAYNLSPYCQEISYAVTYHDEKERDLPNITHDKTN